METQDDYGCLFWMMLLVGIIGLAGFVLTLAAAGG